MSIKPIETVYRGHRFRSRLEARWAVFFSRLGIGWQYEPEGFRLHGDVYYLPDFYLPDDHLWVEIKPGPGHPDDETCAKAEMFRDCSGNAIVVICGDPVEHEGAIFCSSISGGSAGAFDGTARISAGKFCGEPCIALWTPTWHDLYADSGFQQPLAHFDSSEAISSALDSVRPDLYRLAAVAARQARFEHGQVGAPHEWQR